ncbi:hypothetical protein [Spongiimicrobium sp. 2-473A-2-J]|uniref:hypothetical protein n=1 Tax=Eudoraea algarum TaxID=3417568 RepID=UPI003D36AE53
MTGKKNPCNKWAYSVIGGKIGGKKRMFTLNREQLAMNNYGGCALQKRNGFGSKGGNGGFGTGLLNEPDGLWRARDSGDISKNA